MFLYQTTNLYDETGDGPLKGLVIKTTPNGYKDMTSAKKNDVVVFLEEKESSLEAHSDFVVGEKL